MIRRSLQTNRRAGTPYAVETAAGSVYPGSTVEEGAAYGAGAFRFRVVAQVSETDFARDKSDLLQAAVQYYKNARSVFDGFLWRRSVRREMRLYEGQAVFLSAKQQVTCNIPPGFNSVYLTDGQGNLLMDGLTNRLIDRREEENEP